MYKFTRFWYYFNAGYIQHYQLTQYVLNRKVLKIEYKICTIELFVHIFAPPNNGKHNTDR